MFKIQSIDMMANLDNQSKLQKGLTEAGVKLVILSLLELKKNCGKSVTGINPPLYITRVRI